MGRPTGAAFEPPPACVALGHGRRVSLRLELGALRRRARRVHVHRVQRALQLRRARARRAERRFVALVARPQRLPLPVGGAPLAALTHLEHRPASRSKPRSKPRPRSRPSLSEAPSPETHARACTVLEPRHQREAVARAPGPERPFLLDRRPLVERVEPRSARSVVAGDRHATRRPSRSTVSDDRCQRDARSRRGSEAAAPVLHREAGLDVGLAMVKCRRRSSRRRRKPRPSRALTAVEARAPRRGRSVASLLLWRA